MAERLPLSDARRAHELLERSGATGKLVLVPWAREDSLTARYLPIAEHGLIGETARSSPLEATTGRARWRSR